MTHRTALRACSVVTAAGVVAFATPRLWALTAGEGATGTLPAAAITMPLPSLLFDDEFSGSGVDASRWVVSDHGRTGNGEQQCYLPANVAEGGGWLSETARVDSSCAGFAFASGAVQMRSYSVMYGTVQVRAKLSGGTGTWPAIWLLGKGCRPWRMGGGCNPQWPQPGSDEIDIAETLGSAHSAVNQQVHTSAGSPGCMPSVSDTSQSWHVFSLVWRPGSLTWQIDGATTCTLSGAVVPSHPMFLILDTAVGGTGGGIVDSATLPQASAFDYVRVTP